MIRPSRERHPRIVSGTFLLATLVVLPLVAPCAVSAEAPTDETTVTANSSSDGVNSSLVALDEATQLRGSLSMRAAPMSQVFTLLGAMTPLRFRYASPPDAVLTAEWKDALLLPSLEGTLQAARWQMQRKGMDVFVFPSREQKTEAGSAPQGWQYWNDASPPPRRWMATDALKPPRTVQTKPAAPPAVPPQSAMKQPDTGSGSSRIVVGWRTEPTAATAAAWSDVVLNIDASQRPGVRVFLPRVASSSSVKSKTVGSAAALDESVWLRWRLPLNFVPRGARLMLETPVAATLYVNGAPLLSSRSGISTLDLSRVLVTGENYLALHLADVPPALRMASGNHSAVPGARLESSPLFRYEWIFDGAFNGSETNGAAAD